MHLAAAASQCRNSLPVAEAAAARMRQIVTEAKASRIARQSVARGLPGLRPAGFRPLPSRFARARTLGRAVQPPVATVREGRWASDPFVPACDHWTACGAAGGARDADDRHTERHCVSTQPRPTASIQTNRPEEQEPTRSDKALRTRSRCAQGGALLWRHRHAKDFDAETGVLERRSKRVHQPTRSLRASSPSGGRGAGCSRSPCEVQRAARGSRTLHLPCWSLTAELRA